MMPALAVTLSVLTLCHVVTGLSSCRKPQKYCGNANLPCTYQDKVGLAVSAELDVSTYVLDVWKMFYKQFETELFITFKRKHYNMPLINLSRQSNSQQKPVEDDVVYSIDNCTIVNLNIEPTKNIIYEFDVKQIKHTTYSSRKEFCKITFVIGFKDHVNPKHERVMSRIRRNVEQQESTTASEVTQSSREELPQVTVRAQEQSTAASKVTESRREPLPQETRQQENESSVWITTERTDIQRPVTTLRMQENVRSENANNIQATTTRARTEQPVLTLARTEKVDAGSIVTQATQAQRDESDSNETPSIEDEKLPENGTQLSGGTPDSNDTDTLAEDDGIIGEITNRLTTVSPNVSSVQCEFKMDAVFSDVVGTGEKRVAVRSEFQRQITEKLGLHPSQIKDFTLREGSIIFQFKVVSAAGSVVTVSTAVTALASAVASGALTITINNQTLSVIPNSLVTTIITLGPVVIIKTEEEALGYDTMYRLMIMGVTLASAIFCLLLALYCCNKKKPKNPATNQVMPLEYNQNVMPEKPQAGVASTVAPPAYEAAGAPPGCAADYQQPQYNATGGFAGDAHVFYSRDL